MSLERTRLPDWVTHFARFGMVGVAATGIHAAIAISLVAFAHLAPYIANPIAFIGATGFSYVINSRWSFSGRARNGTAPRYFLVATIGCIATAMVSAAAEYARLDYRIGILLVIVLVTPLSFILHNRWTYGSHQ